MTYKTTGTCCTAIDLAVENGVIRSVAFTGGCNGNLQGIARLVTGKKATEAAALLQGITCGHRATSCPDQLAKALLHATTATARHT